MHNLYLLPRCPDFSDTPSAALPADAGLPQHLAERTRPLTAHAPVAGRRMVLYWMHHALRSTENPALDVAITLAARLRLPVLAVLTVPDASPWASDRFHTFVLQGAAELAASLQARGVRLALSVRTADTRSDAPGLPSLFSQAALVVTDEMPVRPWRDWIDAAARQADAAATPLWAVDGACVVPMQLAGRWYDRAFAYRDATRKLRSARLGKPWTDVAADLPALTGELPIPCVDPATLNDAAIADLCARCDIDHTVGPVPHTRGGMAAALARWNTFCSTAIGRYAKRRNDALQPEAVSRMSAYLHYGMIAPTRVAREAHELMKSGRGGPAGEGAEKWLDELLVWRELAYTACFYLPDHDRLSAVPDWARRTLAAHQRDPRPALPSEDTLSRGRTGDTLWDAAQRSLLIHGELHNNVRMTWGKALLQWTPDAATALKRLIDLNHRYALDGRDPSSFGGILWCLGLFDRPFEPERPILGSVRPRPTAEHAERLDPNAYLRLCTRPAAPRPATPRPGHRRPRVLVVGAGLAGAWCARTLADQGMEVTLVDKGRGPGGRTSTRRADGLAWDHGAQYFTFRSRHLQRFADAWMHAGLLAKWHPRVRHMAPSTSEQPDSRWLVAVPGNNALCAHLVSDAQQAGATVRFGVQLASLTREPESGLWSAAPAEGEPLGPFDAVALAIPPANAGPLLTSAGLTDLAAHVSTVRMAPTWALMLAWDKAPDPLAAADVLRWPAPDTAASPDQPVASPLAWAARDRSKPGRSAGASDTWVLHASHAWSAAHVDDPPEAVTEALLAALAQAVGAPLPPPQTAIAHRWRYAAVTAPCPESCLWHATGVAVGGDWCGARASRVEGALLSGSAMAGRLLSWAAMTAATGADAPAEAASLFTEP
jgi:photolyase PhrII